MSKNNKDAITPMMAQYIEIKAANPDCLLFYRMGDFYEMFFEDAIAASRVLGIHLTTRGKHLGEDIPMAGVPVKTAEEYLHKLIDRGFKVAVCEQTENPAEAKKRGHKAVVRREVTRLVTPGTITEESLLDDKANNFLSAAFRFADASGSRFALASIDISTGEFQVGNTPENGLAGELSRLSPGEIIISDNTLGDQKITGTIEHSGAAMSPVPNTWFDGQNGEKALKKHLNVAELDGFGTFLRGEKAAIGALLTYIELTQVGRLPAIRPPKQRGPGTVMAIDAATRTNLELVRSLNGEKKGSLLAAIDRTVTGPGSRELVSRLASPLTSTREINWRLDSVAWLLAEAQLRLDLRKKLRGSPDIARALSRLSLGRGSPRDLGAIRTGLATALDVAELLAAGDTLPDLLQLAADNLAGDCNELLAELTTALITELPVQRRDGGFVQAGYSQELDENRRLRDESQQVMAELQVKYAEQTGIKNLKIRHNNVLGFFIEVTAVNAKPLLEPPLANEFIHRQTMSNAVRFTTSELAETQTKIIAAAEQALNIELEIFAHLVAITTAKSIELGIIASALAELDHYCGLAELAEEQDYRRPVVDDSLQFTINGGRHPVVEQAIGMENSGPFIANDCCLGGCDDNGNSTFDPGQADGERLWVLTGPNMAGKSTFLRQNALIAVLAQIGSFVPANSAHIGVVDRLFSRVGASDDLARGRSTFMVEMVETAAILNQAEEKSLVILDEIGRGTATFDGLSIAWACVEYLHEVNRCRALFATHYHELTAIAGKLANITNATIEVKEWQDKIIFLHKVVFGAADRSYGIQVAKLAGLPAVVIERAGEVLTVLEASERHQASAGAIIEDLPLFAAARPQSFTACRPASQVEDTLIQLNVDALTPRQAIDALYELKGMLA
jgi:DNA mismatch repair protein MutS